MTDEQRITANDTAGATARLHESFLRDLLGDCLPLAHFDHVARRMVGDSLPARQVLLTSVIRSMIDEGLMVVGGIVGGSDERVDPWDMSLADAMAQIHDWYVVHHDDQGWVFGIWFSLTEQGECAAEARKGESPRAESTSAPQVQPLNESDEHDG